MTETTTNEGAEMIAALREIDAEMAAAPAGTPTIEDIANDIFRLLAGAEDHQRTAAALQAALDNQVAATNRHDDRAAAVYELRRIVMAAKDPGERFQAIAEHWKTGDTGATLPPGTADIIARLGPPPQSAEDFRQPYYYALNDLELDAHGETGDRRYAADAIITAEQVAAEIARPAEWRRRYEQGKEDKAAGIDNGRTRERKANDDAYRAGYAGLIR